MQNTSNTHFDENRGTCVPIDKYNTKLKVGPLKIELKINKQTVKHLTELWYAFLIKKVSQKYAQEGPRSFEK